MSKSVTFYLGPTVGITARQLTITRMHRAGDDSAPAAAHDADAGAAETVVVTLPDNTIFQAKLVDTGPGGVDHPARVLNFHTGELQYNHPVAEDGLFRIMQMEDLSSSSSSSESSISTSSSSISTSSSSESSVSSSLSSGSSG